MPVNSAPFRLILTVVTFFGEDATVAVGAEHPRRDFELFTRLAAHPHRQSQVAQGLFLSVRLSGAAPCFQVPAISEFSLFITPS
jgi:hypothetical protein